MPNIPSPQLARLGFATVLPAPALRPYVQNYWLLQQPAAPPLSRAEFMHPDGGLGLVFNFGDDFMFEGVPLGQRVFLDGANTVSRRLTFDGRVAALGVRFWPGGAFPFLGQPLFALIDSHELAPPAGLATLFAQLAEAATVVEMTGRLDAWLQARLVTAALTAPVVGHALGQIRQSGGQLGMVDLSQDIGLSQRQLERLFREQVGLRPKQYARLQRVARARHLLKAVDQPAAAIAYDAGFYDQAHFIREFKGVVGLTPGQYRERSEGRQGDGES